MIARATDGAEGADGPDGTVGLTADAGWELGVRRTLPLPVDAAWQLLLSPEGQQVWLGAVLEPAVGAEGEAADGTRLLVRVLRPGSHLRLAWQRPGWARPSTLQVRVLAAAGGTTVAFHQERLASQELRTELLAHWDAALDRLAELAA